MTLPPRAQMLVDQLVDELGLRSMRPSKIEINIDRAGLVQDVKPLLVFWTGEKKALDTGSKCRQA